MEACTSSWRACINQCLCCRLLPPIDCFQVLLRASGLLHYSIGFVSPPASCKMRLTFTTEDDRIINLDVCAMECGWSTDCTPVSRRWMVNRAWMTSRQS